MALSFSHSADKCPICTSDHRLPSGVNLLPSWVLPHSRRWAVPGNSLSALRYTVVPLRRFSAQEARPGEVPYACRHSRRQAEAVFIGIGRFSVRCGEENPAASRHDHDVFSYASRWLYRFYSRFSHLRGSALACRGRSACAVAMQSQGRCPTRQ